MYFPGIRILNKPIDDLRPIFQVNTTLEYRMAFDIFVSGAWKTIFRKVKGCQDVLSV